MSLGKRKTLSQANMIPTRYKLVHSDLTPQH
jgi:hypothetical protein